MLLTIFCPVVRSQEHLAPIMSFHLSLFKMVGLHYMPFFACHDCKDNTSSAAGLKIYRIQLSGDELRLVLTAGGLMLVGAASAQTPAQTQDNTAGAGAG